MQKSTFSSHGHHATRAAAPGHSSRLHRFSASAYLLTGIAVVTLVCSCSKPPPPPEPTPEPTPVITTPPPTPKPTPTPPPTPTPLPTPTPVVHRYAPDGIYYVTEDFTAHITGGLVGVTAGTQVKMLKENGDMAQVTDGTTPFEVKKSQLTNDLDIAAALVKRSQAIEASTNAARAEQDASAAKQQADQIKYLQEHPLTTPVPSPRR